MASLLKCLVVPGTLGSWGRDPQTPGHPSPHLLVHGHKGRSQKHAGLPHLSRASGTQHHQRRPLWHQEERGPGWELWRVAGAKTGAFFQRFSGHSFLGQTRDHLTSNGVSIDKIIINILELVCSLVTHGATCDR